MRIKKDVSEVTEGDLTPMIDMTFQLIAFFMVVISFSETEQDQAIRLPASQLAKPPDKALTKTRTIQLTKEEKVLFSGDRIGIGGLGSLLRRERTFITDTGGSLSDVTIIIRADKDARTGLVQEIIEMCQENGFEKFTLKAKQERDRAAG